MTRTPEEILIKRLQAEAERPTWAINSTVYNLHGKRYIVWTNDKGGFGVAALSQDYGKDPYEAAHVFQRELRIKRQECEACA